jgi:hypothetical protein
VLPFTPGSNLLERARRGPAEIDGTALRQPGGELVALELAIHDLEDGAAGAARRDATSS